MKRVIERVLDYAVQISEPLEVVLFGSMADGTDNVHSDLDLLLVVDEGCPTWQIAGLVKRYAYEFALRADVLVYTRRELEEKSEQPDSFLASVLGTGTTIYIKSGQVKDDSISCS
jgi:predicted nucleotidyltransferase